jgi:hypothetical protein
MSTLIWKNIRKPGPDGIRGAYDPSVYEGRCKIPDAVRFPMENEQIVALPDARLYRSLSRTGLLLIATSWPGYSAIKGFLDSDPFSVGIYCAIEQGPNDFWCAKQMTDTPPDDFAATYKRLRSAKQYLNQLPSVPPSQLSILMGIMGPQYVYQDSHYAGLHALDQAEFDLNAGIVQAAMICTSFTLEDPLINMRVLAASASSKPVSEGAAAIILGRGNARRDWSSEVVFQSDANYGIAQQLIGAAETYE